MYIPVEDAEQDAQMSSGQLKVRREQERRVARKRVQEGIEGWAKVLGGETGRPYFKVGEIYREPGWLEKLPKRQLCKLAVEARPKRDAKPPPRKPKGRPF